MLAILKGYDDFLVDWAFTELPPSQHQMKAQHQGGEKIRTHLPNCFVIVCQCAKGIMSLLEESSCQNHNAWATSVPASFGSILIFRRKKKCMGSCSDKESWFAKKIPLTEGHTLDPFVIADFCQHISTYSMDL